MSDSFTETLEDAVRDAVRRACKSFEDDFCQVYDLPEMPKIVGLSEWLPMTQLPMVLSPVCECGVDAAGGGIHSSYCPKKS